MIFIVCLSVFAVAQATIWDSLTANIAVIEYQPYLNDSVSSQDLLQINTHFYVTELATLNGRFDLVIFPEATLKNDPNSAVEININYSCDDPSEDAPALCLISYAAKFYQTYIVINLYEKQRCASTDPSQNCQNYGFHFYNTDVVFDRNGTIIEKYQKYNLFGETGIDTPPTPQEVTIKTDFGVKFGIFTCFDILFRSPAQDLLDLAIDGAIFPTMWFSQLPFLTAMQTQQMFAQTHDIMLFAAGANDPNVGSGGSGVYRGAQGALLRGVVANGGTNTFLYKSVNGTVPSPEPEDVDVLAKDMDQFFLKKDASVIDYTSLVLNTSISDHEKQLCHESFCCNFSIKISKNSPKENLHSYTYLLLAYSGFRIFSGVRPAGLDLCGIIACLNSSLSSCGERFPNYDNVQWPVTFEEITVVGRFGKGENYTQFPSSLLSSIRPIQVNETIWTSEDVEEDRNVLVERTFAIKKEQNRLLTFAIYGRDFSKDAPPVTN